MIRMKQMTATRGNISQPSKEVDREHSVVELTRFASDFLMDQCGASKRFNRYRVADLECHVRYRRADTKPLECGELITSGASA
jgi:DNA polymerase II large subunit